MFCSEMPFGGGLCCVETRKLICLVSPLIGFNMMQGFAAGVSERTVVMVVPFVLHYTRAI